MSAYSKDDPDPAKFTIWWLNEERDADMDCGSFETQEEAETALPAILAELLDQCEPYGPTEEAAYGKAGILAGSFHLEWPEDEDGNRGQTVRMAWPGEVS